jgi:hypothetical protein
LRLVSMTGGVAETHRCSQGLDVVGTESITVVGFAGGGGDTSKYDDREDAVGEMLVFQIGRSRSYVTLPITNAS